MNKCTVWTGSFTFLPFVSSSWNFLDKIEVILNSRMILNPPFVFKPKIRGYTETAVLQGGKNKTKARQDTLMGDLVQNG